MYHAPLVRSPDDVTRARSLVVGNSVHFQSMRRPGARGRHHRPTLETLLAAHWGVRITGAEVFEHDEIFCLALVRDGDALFRGIGGDEQLVLRHLAVTDQAGRLDGVLADRAVAR